MVLVDDDSIIGVSKILDLIKCHDDQQSDPIAIGEIFGRNIILNPTEGFDYIGGGSGKIFNRMTVEKLVNLSTEQKCKEAG